MNKNTLLTDIFRIPKEQQKTLEKLGLLTVFDLLYFFPLKYGDFDKVVPISETQNGDSVSIYAEVLSIKARKTFKTNIAITEAVLQDSSAKKIKAIWFSQPYISKMLKKGDFAKFSGTISEKNNSLLISNPEFEKVKNISLDQTGSLFQNQNEEKKDLTLFPVYRQSGIGKGKITSKWIYHKIKKILSDNEFVESVIDPLPEFILKKYNLPSLKNAFFYLHMPKKIELSESAKKRFAFEEIFLIQVLKNIQKEQYKKSGSFKINPTKELQEKLQKSFGFEFTKGQKETLKDILKDFKSDTPMSRLVEGDVGSGKTAVAVSACLFASKTKPKNQSFGNLQSAYMAPTEILAKQIFAEFVKYLKDFNLKIALLTSKDVKVFPSKVNPKESAKISKKKLAEMILNGEIAITVGTHALISKKIFFENLGLVVIDEQHRFGKNQRASLRDKPKSKKESLKKGDLKKSEKIVKKGVAKNEEILPHLLSMTATPIPRTLALSLYGDLDLSVIEEMPKGRKKAITKIVKDKKAEKEKVYKEVKKELENGRQMYVVCPRIDEPNPDKARALNVASAVATHKQLCENQIFKDYKIGLLHSKMKKEKKDEIMNDFLEKKYDILVSTSVIEVGVSVANASVILIEGGERFGLSQLHQLRGRVLRSTHQPYCYIFTKNNITDITRKRLDAIVNAKNGFELAEYDLSQRGAGEILGNKQSGISDLAMEAMKNLKMVEFARKEAESIVKKDKWKEYGVLEERIKEIEKKVYME
ncbi:hypothetical protein CSB11_00845 [Candidatus Campbellbacteria bacterium]|nr:MAG: hypothetical protein CSB11_00845 [Candidatus Campbellbacteria bacterium]